jgi:type IV secretory pathway VirB10-like protein
MATTPPPSSPSPQQQPVPQGTTSPQKRRVVLVLMAVVILVVLYSILHPGASKTPRHKKSDGKDITATEEQINAAMLANKAEIEAEKLRQERAKKKQEVAAKTVDFEKKLAAPRVLRGGGSSAPKESAPSIVFDVTGEQQWTKPQDTATARPRFPGHEQQDRALEIARRLIAESKEQNREQQQNDLPSEAVNDGRYRQVSDAKPPESDRRETLMRAHLLYPNPDWPKTVLPEGTMIETVLKNRLEGANDGPVEVMLTTDVYLRGTHKLIFPQGTTISGETKRVNMLEQERLAVFFHRALVQLSDGTLYGVSLDAPALDQAGAVALHDKVNHHYLQIFGASLAVGAIGGLVNIGNTYGGYGGYDTGSVIRSGIGSEMGLSARQIMARYLNRLPEIVIREGTRVKIMLMGDLPVPFYPEEDSKEDQTQ